ncbi:hypothetical protein HYZ06_02260 [Candidatus Daviesbacteria bacterium]|nr:hypothetical protein [Candidatus Daviesbacteria bacterium]
MSLVKNTVRDLGIEDKTKLTIRPWLPWFWQPLLINFAWHAPILTINGKLISQGIVPDKLALTKALSENVVQTTEFGKV